MFQSIIIAILTLLAGIGIFLVACQMMSSNLESAGSERLKVLLTKASSSRWLGVGMGALGTALIQSSGATTVMVIGFVNVGIMSLTQAATIIYGANIGTTITAQIVALGMFGGDGISTTTLFATLAGIGAFMGLFAKTGRMKTAGGIVTGFGMLFVGLSIMSGAMKDFANMESVRTGLATISNPVLLVFMGTILTAIVQSSSVMTSVALTMVVTGLIGLDQGIYLTLGSNIGSCVVAIIAGITSSVNAKRTALIHLLFNCFGVVVFMVMGLLLALLFNSSFGALFEMAFPSAPQLQLAMFHTVFNLFTVIIMMPLTDVLVRLVCRIIPNMEPETTDVQPHYFFVDEHMLTTPIVAVRQTKLEIEHMAALAIRNYDRSLQMVTTLNFDSMDEFRQDEEQLDYLNHSLINYIVRLNAKALSDEDHRYLTGAIRTIADLERIGDYAENITEYAEILHTNQEKFSNAAIGEIEQLRNLVFAVYENIMKAYMDNDHDAYWRAHQFEDEVDNLTDLMEQRHIERMAAGTCTATVGAQYIELASNSERISDHLINVGKTIGGLFAKSHE